MADKYLEIKLYLKDLNERISNEKIVELILNKDINELENFLNTYKFTYNELVITNYEDDEVKKLITIFINNYSLIKTTYNLLINKESIYNKMDEVLDKNKEGVEIVCDIYKSDTRLSNLLSKYDSESLDKNLTNLCRIKAVTSSYDEDPSYELTKFASSYVKEKYFYNEPKKLRKEKKNEKKSN